MTLPVVILGAGEFVEELLDAIDACRMAGQPLEIVGIVDDDQSCWRTDILGVPILGGAEWLDGDSCTRDIQVIGGYGLPEKRRRLVRQALARGLSFCTIIYPTAQISSRALLGKGDIILAGVVIESGACVRPIDWSPQRTTSLLCRPSARPNSAGRAVAQRGTKCSEDLTRNS